MLTEIGAKDWRTKVLKGDGLILVDFSAPWCGPCRVLEPVMEKIAKEFKGRLTLLKVNTDRLERLTERLKVESVPTLIFMREGRELSRQVGVPTKRELAATVKRLLA